MRRRVSAVRLRCKWTATRRYTYSSFDIIRFKAFSIFLIRIYYNCNFVGSLIPFALILFSVLFWLCISFFYNVWFRFEYLWSGFNTHNERINLHWPSSAEWRSLHGNVLKIIFNFWNYLYLAEEYWWGFSTRNVHMVHIQIVNQIRFKMCIHLSRSFFLYITFLNDIFVYYLNFIEMNLKC